MEEEIYSPDKFPESAKNIEVFEPWVLLEIIFPPDAMGQILKTLQEHEAEIGEMKNISESRTLLQSFMPLRELMRNFFDDLKSVSSGRASLSYEVGEYRRANVARLNVLVGEKVVPAFARIVSRERMEREAEAVVEKLHKVLPRALFALKIQAEADGRIIRSRTLPALKKDVTGYLYGGDRTRKMKLWEKQKKGKKRLKEKGGFDIPHDVFLKMMKI